MTGATLRRVVDGEAPRDLEGTAVPFIRTKNVTKRFVAGGEVISAVDGLSIGIDRGEFVSLVGPSGCGKSTMMLMIAGLAQPTSGEITIGERLITAPYTDLGIAFQRPELLDWRTCLQNVLLQIQIRRWKREDYEPIARQLLDQVGLADFIDKYPHELSGGMEQRVALCRALVHDPEILLLDEPFGALDALTRDQMNADLQRIWLEKRKTALLVTHSIDEAVWLSDRVLVMTPRPGRILADLAIDLPRPRRLDIKTSSEFNAYTGQVRDLFKEIGVLRQED